MSELYKTGLVFMPVTMASVHSRALTGSGSAWSLVIPKGMFSEERRKENHRASKLQAQSMISHTSAVQSDKYISGTPSV